MAFSGVLNDACPAYSWDGRELYFASRRSLEEGKPAMGWSIWVADKQGVRWAPPRPLGSPVNLINENSPSLTQKNELVFASDRPGGLGKFDIYRSAFSAGHYGKPENLGSAVNSGDQDVHPWIAPDGSYLLFASLGRSDSLGGADLYISFRKEDGSWGQAANLGPAINSTGDEYYARVSPDGEYLFYSSRRNGILEVYWVDATIIHSIKSKAASRENQE
jgi:Tol biopolymer transport system component